MGKADDLYSGDFDDFVARRNALAKKLRDGGDAEAADEVKALKKPSRGAWAINQLSASQAKTRKDLLAAGAALRKASGRDAVRKATERERDAVDKARDATQAIATKAGAKLSPAALDKVRETLHAVALDDDVRAEFEAHRLTTEHEASSFGGLIAGGGPAPARKSGKKAKAAKKPTQTKRQRDQLKAAMAEAHKLELKAENAEAALEEAAEAAKRAERDLRRATQARDRAAKESAAARKKAEKLAAS